MMPLFLDSILSVALFTCVDLTFVLNFNVLYMYGTQKGKKNARSEKQFIYMYTTYMPLHISSYFITLYGFSFNFGNVFGSSYSDGGLTDGITIVYEM